MARSILVSLMNQVLNAQAGTEREMVFFAKSQHACNRLEAPFPLFDGERKQPTASSPWQKSSFGKNGDRRIFPGRNRSVSNAGRSVKNASVPFFAHRALLPRAASRFESSFEDFLRRAANTAGERGFQQLLAAR